MINAQNTKLVNLTPPGAIVDNAAFTVAALDTLGFDYAQIILQMGATDIGLTTCKLQECETSGGTYTDVTGASFTVAATDDNKLYSWDVNMAGNHKRYLKPSIVGGDGTAGSYACVLGVLSRGSISPYDNTTRGLANSVQV